MRIAAIDAFTALKKQTERSIARAVAAAEATEMIHTLCHTLTFGAALPAAITGDWTAFNAYAARVVQLANDKELALWSVYARMLRGIGAIAAGQESAGKTDFGQAQDILTGQGFLFMRPTFWVVYALAEQAGGLEVPTGCLDALERDVRAGERWMLPVCLRLKSRWRVS